MCVCAAAREEDKADEETGSSKTGNGFVAVCVSAWREIVIKYDGTAAVYAQEQIERQISYQYTQGTKRSAEQAGWIHISLYFDMVYICVWIFILHRVLFAMGDGCYRGVESASELIS